jgi:hypothetical protein
MQLLRIRIRFRILNTAKQGVQEYHLKVKWCILGNGSLKWFNEQTSLAIPKEIIQLGHVFRQTQTAMAIVFIQSVIFKVLGLIKKLNQDKLILR